MPKITPIKADINNIGEKRRTTGQRLETSVFNLLSEPPSRCIRRLGHVTAASWRRRRQIDAGRPLALPFDEGAFISRLWYLTKTAIRFSTIELRVEFFWSDPRHSSGLVWDNNCYWELVDFLINVLIRFINMRGFNIEQKNTEIIKIRLSFSHSLHLCLNRRLGSTVVQCSRTYQSKVS